MVGIVFEERSLLLQGNILNGKHQGLFPLVWEGATLIQMAHRYDPRLRGGSGLVFLFAACMSIFRQLLETLSHRVIPARAGESG